MPNDAVAGLLLAAIAIPEQLATARLANMPPVSGLFAFAAGTLAFAVFGVNRYVSVGADSTIAPIFAGSIAALAAAGTSEYTGLVGLTALIAGAILVAAGVLRAGWIADLLSVPVTIGFLAGISAHIVVGQLPLVLGTQQPAGSLPQKAFALFQGAPSANWPSVLIGTGVCAVALASERAGRRFPGALLALGVATALAAFFHLETYGVAMLGALNVAFAGFRLPPLGVADIVRALPISLIVALVCIVQTAAVVRAFPSDPDAPDEAGRDFGAVGAGSIIAALTGTFAVDASPPRTAVVAQAGGRSQLAGIFAVVAVALVATFGASFAAHVPLAALGGVLIAIGIRLLRTREMLDVARRGAGEIWFVVAAAALIIVLPIESGMLLAIALSLARGVYAVARPPSAEFLRVPGTTIWWPPEGETAERMPGVVVFGPAAPIAFTNARYIVERLRAAVAAAPQPVKALVIECSGVSGIDYSGGLVLCAEVRALRARSIRVALARLWDPRAQEDALRAGVVASLGEGCVFKSVSEALTAFAAG